MLTTNKYIFCFLSSNLLCFLIFLTYSVINNEIIPTKLYLVFAIPYVLFFLITFLEKRFNTEYAIKVIIILCSILIFWFDKNIFGKYHTFSEYSLTSIVYTVLLIIFAACSPKTKQNSLFGVRIRYTLEFEEVWDKTHKMFSLILSFFIIPCFLTIFYLHGINKFIISNLILLTSCFLGITYACVIGKPIDKLHKEKEAEELQEHIKKERGY